MNRKNAFLAAAIAVAMLGAAAYFAVTLLGTPAPSPAGVASERAGAEPDTGGAAGGNSGDSGDAWPEATESETAADAGGRIQVTLYVLGSSGLRLTTETREIPLERSLQPQAAEVVRLLLRRSAAFPRGVELREVFITSQGVAYVDLSRELVANHPGGTSAEELTVYGLSNTLVANFPAIQRVRILVEGREIQTLAGHLDLTVPFGRAPSYLRPPSESPESRDEAS